MVPHRNAFNQRLSLKPMAVLKWEWKVVFLINNIAGTLHVDLKCKLLAIYFPNKSLIYMAA